MASKYDDNYQKALEKIRIAKKEQATELDLSNMGLRSVPPEVGELVHLETLLLYSSEDSDNPNRLTNLPKNIKKLSHLTKLRLTNNEMESLPSIISELKHLKYLRLGGNPFKNLSDVLEKVQDIEFVAFRLDTEQLKTYDSALRKLKGLGLNFANQGLTEIPKEVFGFENLEELWVYSNKIENIPSEIERLRKLKLLNIAENQIKELPNSLFDLKNLEKLYAYSNEIEDIPSKIGQLQKLKVLSIFGNQVKELPKLLFDLENLEELYIYSNKLESIPSEIGQLKKLKKLYLRDNKISQLPPAIAQLQQLEILEFSQNQIKELLLFLFELKNLEELWAHSNEIESIPSEIGQFQKLKLLSIFGNQIEELPELLFDLKNLEELYVYSNKLESIPSEIRQLKRLKKLYVRENRISQLPQEITQLQQLEILDFSKNQIKVLPSFLFELKNLKELWAYVNEIKNIPSEIGQLKKLKKLILRENKITRLPPEIVQLQQLKILEFSKTQIKALPSFLFELKSLEELWVFGNKIESIPIEIGQLKKLKKLYIRENKISQLPQEIAQLQQLEVFDFSQTQIKELPPFLFELKNLEELWAHSNEIESIPIEIGQLKKLKKLYIRENKISQLPQEIAQLQQLEELEIQKNQIEELPPFLFKLKNLEDLRGHSNQVKSIPSKIGQLKKLKTLTLGYNEVSVLPIEIRHLQKLERLHLTANKITDISPLLPLIKMEKMEVSMDYKGSGIELEDNPIQTPPKEIVAKGNQAIIDYYEELQKGKDYLFEAKTLILGESGAGKTTFSRKIQRNSAEMPLEEETTKGIDVQRWKFGLTQQVVENCLETSLQQESLDQLVSKGFLANLWDFGGQEVYHGTHQFFLTRQALYILIADTRKQDTDFNYWLNIAEQLGDNSPLIILLNERHGHPFRIDETGLKGRYGKFLKEVRTINLGDTNHQNLNKLRSKIKSYLTDLPHIGDELPASWVNIRKEITKVLEEKQERYISIDLYMHICRDNEITEISKMLNLSDYFHRIGVFLHYQDDPILKHTIFLDANWTTKTVYKLLNDPTVKNNQGRFTKAEAYEIWKGEEHILLVDKFLQLLERFSIAYNIKNTEDYIAPELLSKVQPYERWPHTDTKRLLIFSYVFDNFMPKGLMPRLTVMLNDYIVDQERVWLRGVNLSKGNAHAEIIETYGSENRFDIRIAGEDKKELLVTIMDAFNSLLKPFKKLTYKRFVPCNCEVCVQTEDIQEKSFYNYNDLKKRLSKRKKTVECSNNDYEDVDILPMLEDIGVQFRNEENELAKHSMDESANEYRSEKKGKKIIPQTSNQTSDKKDFFISYNRYDKEWAEWIGWILEDDGYSVLIQAWDFGVGANFALEMHQAMQKSHRTIAILSETYLESAFTKPEWAGAFINDPTGKERRLIPIKVKECNPEGLLQGIVYLDLLGLDEKQATQQLLQLAQDLKVGRSKPDFVSFPKQHKRQEFPG